MSIHQRQLVLPERRGHLAKNYWHPEVPVRLAFYVQAVALCAVCVWCRRPCNDVLVPTACHAHMAGWWYSLSVSCMHKLHARQYHQHVHLCLQNMLTAHSCPVSIFCLYNLTDCCSSLGVQAIGTGAQHTEQARQGHVQDQTVLSVGHACVCCTSTSAARPR